MKKPLAAVINHGLKRTDKDYLLCREILRMKIEQIILIRFYLFNPVSPVN